MAPAATAAAAAADLKGKVALVTGATSGIGYETAANLAGGSGAGVVCNLSGSIAPTTELQAHPDELIPSTQSKQTPTRPHPTPPHATGRGAEVILGVRNVEAGQKIAEEIRWVL